MTVAVLVGLRVACAQGERHAVSGRYAVPLVFVRASSERAAGRNVVSNAGFESGKIDGGWYQCGDAAAYVTREHPYDGSYDEYSGTRSGVGEPHGNSGVCQRVRIPLGASLTVRLYQLSDEGAATYAFQEGDLLDDRGNVVVNLYRCVNDDRRWLRGEWNLAAYAGRTFWLYFGVHGDGDAAHSTQQFVDDVSLAGRGEASGK